MTLAIRHVAFTRPTSVFFDPDLDETPDVRRNLYSGEQAPVIAPMYATVEARQGRLLGGHGGGRIVRVIFPDAGSTRTTRPSGPGNSSPLAPWNTT